MRFENLRIKLTILTVFATAAICFPQDRPKAVLVNELGRGCSEELMASYDHFMGQLTNDPSAIGKIVVYGDRSAEGRNLNYIRFLRDIYPSWRQFDSSRIEIIRGVNEEKMKIQFWAVPSGGDPPSIDAPFREQTTDSTFRFDAAWADFNRWSGRRDIYSNGFLELGCDFSPNRGEFAKRLLAAPTVNGYLVVYTAFGKDKNHGDRIARFAVDELVKSYKVPRNRLKTVYGGNRKEPEIEFWFVPSGSAAPVPRPDPK